MVVLMGLLLQSQLISANNSADKLKFIEFQFFLLSKSGAKPLLSLQCENAHCMGSLLPLPVARLIKGKPNRFYGLLVKNVFALADLLIKKSFQTKDTKILLVGD